ncbi:MAG: type II toxin-antitoxin system HicB family antitoxin [Candidatus Magnetobacterium sp. LHC-1]|uniref:2-oxoisovalerate dehydrogenase n=1 Tax=Candidatus Magnetobacterium casense TaxID=1455061 RepID=A0ABS6RXT1_9BACT|nr:type II toxin-antitoxin system HicB family antitoxin [Candidatus Magnetobacterium casensis]MBF0609333.1 2-oxoisovalerate dehydrogenase [Nitrospirota bacterium]MBV6341445.1 2-oxoisovalerate dehydrogenase [Candidatus Magnetobacterium casensis]
MIEITFIVEKEEEYVGSSGGYCARAEGYSIFTEGDTMDELKENIKDALSCHFDNEEDIPQIIRLHEETNERF